MTAVLEPMIDASQSHAPAPPRPDWRPGVSRLLSTREDLRGVYATADYVDEALRWSA